MFDYSLRIVKSESVTQLCLILRYPMDCSLPGTSVCGILQARILEWIAFPSPEHLPDLELQPGSPVLQTDCLLSKPAGKPLPENRLLTKIQNWKPWHRISFTYICWDIYTVPFDTTLLLKQIFYRNAQMETNSRGLD